MKFQDVPPANLDLPDSNSQAVARLSAAFPKVKLPPGTVMLLREKFEKYPESVVRRAVSTLVDSCRAWPTIAEVVSALKQAESEDGIARGGFLDLSGEAYARLSIPERKMLSHAKDVLWAADYQRRATKAPSALQELDVAQEIVAHGVWIAEDGSKLAYDPRLILRPDAGCVLRRV